MNGPRRLWHALPVYGSEMWMVALRNEGKDAREQPFSPVAGHLAEEHARRIAAAMNILADIPTEVLEKTARHRRQPAGAPA